MHVSTVICNFSRCEPVKNVIVLYGNWNEEHEHPAVSPLV